MACESQAMRLRRTVYEDKNASPVGSRSPSMISMSSLSEKSIGEAIGFPGNFCCCTMPTLLEGLGMETCPTDDASGTTGLSASPVRPIQIGEGLRLDGLLILS